MSLSAEARAKYTPIIDGLLKASNLEEVSAKRIRDSLQRAVDEDLSDYKSDLKTLIHERFDIVSNEHEAKPKPAPSPKPKSKPKPEPNGTPILNGTTSPNHTTVSSPTPNGVSSASPLSTADDEPDDRPKKKQKTNRESDAALAARLQAEENGRSRPTRGGAVRKKAAPVKKTPKKKKSKARVDDEDDSEAAGSGAEEGKRKKKPGGAFNAPLQLSEPLAALLGEQQLSRPQTVKRIWDHIKGNNLQHENDRRQIRCDDQMRAIFNQDNIHMFSMNKTLSKHLYPLPEAQVNGES